MTGPELASKGLIFDQTRSSIGASLTRLSFRSAHELAGAAVQRLKGQMSWRSTPSNSRMKSDPNAMPGV